MTYDQAERRTALVLTFGLTANYSYDTLSDTTQINYLGGGTYSSGTCSPGTTSGGKTGNLTYAFDVSVRPGPCSGAGRIRRSC